MTSFFWISNSAFRNLTNEADRAYPFETGGVLVGYVAVTGEPVIFEAIGPGPKAIHRRTRFNPDHAWQCEQLNALFERSSGRWTYLGDWHTHPNGSPRMSWLDHRTLHSIAIHPQAQMPRPLMLIGGGAAQSWDWEGHLYLTPRLFGLLTECEEIAPRIFHQT